MEDELPQPVASRKVWLPPSSLSHLCLLFHCHLYYDSLVNDIDNVILRANEAGVSRLVCVGTNIEDSKKCLSITENNDDIFADSIRNHGTVVLGAIPSNTKKNDFKMNHMTAVGIKGLDIYEYLDNKWKYFSSYYIFEKLCLRHIIKILIIFIGSANFFSDSKSDWDKSGFGLEDS